jgi:hypothetical protein
MLRNQKKKLELIRNKYEAMITQKHNIDKENWLPRHSKKWLSQDSIPRLDFKNGKYLDY